MKWLERRAIKRAQRRLAPTLERGEHVVDFDVGTDPDRRRVDIVATDRSLIFIPGGRADAATRVPYDSVCGSVDVAYGHFYFGGTDISIRFRGRTRQSFASFVVSQMALHGPRFAVHSVDICSGWVVFTLIGDELTMNYRDLDPHDADVKAEVRDALLQFEGAYDLVSDAHAQKHEVSRQFEWDPPLPGG